MMHRYSFIPVFAGLLGGLAWWSSNISDSTLNKETTEAAWGGKAGSSQVIQRRDLLETLDKVVAYQHYYHSVYGRFTKLLNRTGLHLSRSVTDHFDVRVVEANADRLLVNAFSEMNGQVLDLVSIDQDFQVHANFEFPPPRIEYLKEQAKKHLRLIAQTPNGQLIAEQGVFKGYFQYTFQTDSKGIRTGIARGIRAPVKGIQMEPGGDEVSLGESENLLISSLIQDSAGNQNSLQTGQQPDGAPGRLEEEAFLAQKIFLGEMGRYAKNWSELAKIAHFRFEGKEQIGPDEVLSFGQKEVEKKADSDESGQPKVSRKITSHSSKALEIEPIFSDK